MQANVDFVEKNNLDIGVGLSNGVMRVTITPMVHDSITASVFSVFGGLFNILIGFTSSSYNVLVASIDWQKIVLHVPIVGSKDRKRNVMQIPKFGIGGFVSKMDFESA
jgi:hypothetical protein